MLIAAEKQLIESDQIELPPHGRRSSARLLTRDDGGSRILLTIDLNRVLRAGLAMTCQLRYGNIVLLRLCFQRRRHINRPPCPPPYGRVGPVHLHRYVEGVADAHKAPCAHTIRADQFASHDNLVETLKEFVEFCGVRSSGVSQRGIS